MVINGSIAQIRSTHCIESCMSWFGKAPRRPSQIRDNCQAVDGKPWHAAEVRGVPVQSRLLKAFELVWPDQDCCGCYDDACARTPIAASTKRRSQLSIVRWRFISSGI